MIVKELIRPLPGVRQLSLLRQRMGFRSSAQYWYGSRTWCCELGEGARVVDVILLLDGRA